jgi:hypothetical protein
MRLTYPESPSAIRALAYRALNLELVRFPHPEQGSASPPHEATHHVPSFHKVFLLPLRAVSAADLRAAKHTSWYDIVVLSGIRVGIEVATAKGKTGPSTYVFRGPDIDRQIAILTALAGDPAEYAGEVRILRVPPVAPFSIWLHGRRKGQDRIVPVVATSRSLEIGKVYEPADFLDAIRDTAARLAGNRNTKAGPRKRGGNRPAK